MKTLKKLVAVVAALALAVGLSVTCSAATWGSYFGINEAWFEGAEGELTAQTESSWTANMKSIGWGGVWGAQVFQPAGAIELKKGEEYNLKCTLSSSDLDKWVFIKIATDEDIAFAKWVQIKAGGSVTIDETFTAAANANSIYFGIGGDFGDRADEEAAYTYAEGGADSIDDGDPLLGTKISCSGFFLGTPDGEGVSTGDATVDTGDFAPIAYGAIALVAGVAVVLFARKRETE